MSTAAAGWDADRLLSAAALFADRDHGGAGYLGRFTRQVAAEPGPAGEAIARALSARARAGVAGVVLRSGDLRVVSTSAGASLLACAVAGPGGGLAVSVRVVDDRSLPVAGVCVRVRDRQREHAVVTDGAGSAAFRGTGAQLAIEVGGREAAAGGGDRESARPAAGRIIAFPRSPRPDDLELAAASPDEPGPAAPGPRRIEAGGVTFWYRERRLGCDLTLVVPGLGAGTGDCPAGAFGAGFVTTGRDGDRDRWIVPLAPSPRGLAGSLHSTGALGLDEQSVEVGAAGHLLASLGGDLTDVVRRSIRHADSGTAWMELSRRLGHGRVRAVVEAALAERQDPR